MDCGYVSPQLRKASLGQSELLHPFNLGLFPRLQVFYLWIGKCCNEMFIRDVLGCLDYASIPSNMVRRTVARLISHLNLTADVRLKLKVEIVEGVLL